MSDSFLRLAEKQARQRTSQPRPMTATERLRSLEGDMRSRMEAARDKRQDRQSTQPAAPDFSALAEQFGQLVVAAVAQALQTLPAVQPQPPAAKPAAAPVQPAAPDLPEAPAVIARKPPVVPLRFELRRPDGTRTVIDAKPLSDAFPTPVKFTVRRPDGLVSIINAVPNPSLDGGFIFTVFPPDRGTYVINAKPVGVES